MPRCSVPATAAWPPCRRPRARRTMPGGLRASPWAWRARWDAVGMGWSVSLETAMGLGRIGAFTYIILTHLSFWDRVGVPASICLLRIFWGSRWLKCWHRRSTRPMTRPGAERWRCSCSSAGPRHLDIPRLIESRRRVDLDHMTMIAPSRWARFGPSNSGHFPWQASQAAR